MSAFWGNADMTVCGNLLGDEGKLVAMTQKE
jgi:hypothetical protein